MREPTAGDIALGNNNERMIEANLWSYWAHLSIYRFAAPYCLGRDVLDAGSGVGYGAAYLARNGANVHACDVDAESIRHSQRTYLETGLSYAIADLNEPLPMASNGFDVVFSSNVFEHVSQVDCLAAECARVVKRDGVVIVAVPPITTAAVARADMKNQHHVHHLPPAAWHAKLSRFFADIRCHGHQGIGHWNDPQLTATEISRWTDEVTIRETDFEFPEVALSDLNQWQCITAVFVCRQPRAVALLETIGERSPAEWHVSALAAGIIAEERASRAQHDLMRAQQDLLDSQELDRLRKDLALIRSSTSWRITLPVQALAARVKKLRSLIVDSRIVGDLRRG